VGTGMLIDETNDSIFSPSSVVVNGFGGTLGEKLESWVSGNPELLSGGLGTCVFGIEL